MIHNMGISTDDINLILSCLAYSIRIIADRELTRAERTTELFTIITEREESHIKILIYPRADKSIAIFSNKERD